jgi:hypothetical protein
VADALQNLLDVFHKTVVEDRLVEFDMSEVALALATLPAGLAFLIQGGHAQAQVVGSAPHRFHPLIQSCLSDLRY